MDTTSSFSSAINTGLKKAAEYGKLAAVFKNIGVGIYASQKLGWIALGLYIKKMSAVPYNRSFNTILDCYRATGISCVVDAEINLIMKEADNYRMIYFPGEFVLRLRAIESMLIQYHLKQLKKSQLIQIVSKTRKEMEA